MLIGLHSTNTTEWLAIPADDPLAAPRVVLPRARGRRVRRRPPHAGDGRRGWFVVLTNDDGPGLPGPGRARRRPWARTTAAWREVVPHRPGVRIEDVDAFAGALVLSERAEAETLVRVAPAAARTATPSPATCSAAGWIVALDREPRRRPGSAPTPSPTRRRCASAARRW